jgi:2-polyprenyl-3-methyl-5-hydroxy-6-metoxy-1,4-benzoquinol methylase
MAEQIQTPIEDRVLYNWGTEEMTLHHQMKYLRHFQDAPGKVLEIGCGHGIMLGRFKDAGIDAYGLDLSDEAVKVCRAKNLEAVSGEVISHLKNLQANSLGGIFCAHVIEHLDPTGAFELISESFRVLKKGSKIIFITPNAKDLRTTERFWLDITHVRPYPEKLMEFLLLRQGFAGVQAFTDEEPSKNILEKIAKKFLRLWFMGYIFTGDLVVIAER